MVANISGRNKKGSVMAGTRTAPTVNGTPQFINVSVTVYDYTGDQRTDSYQLDADSTSAEIEAFVAALQACTNATIWRVVVGNVYNSVGDSSNAVEEVWENAKDNIVALAKNASNQAEDFFIPAPSNDLFIETTEEVDPANAELAAWLASILPMRAGYSFVSARFSHRRQIGTKIAL